MDKKKENVIQIEPNGIELKSGLLFILVSVNVNVFDVVIRMN